MTLDDFLAWDDGTDRRYELWDGVVRAMAPPMPRHGRLAAKAASTMSAVENYASRNGDRVSFRR